jgi:glycylpeptide N-tetradecanoyltransferase
LIDGVTRALTPPGWKTDWHIGVRSSTTHKLLAFISAIPKSLRVRKNVLPVFEFNFLCIDRELRGKRLTPILITEVTRRCNRENIWHAFHTGGVVLPQSVSVCRYFHRPLNFRTLYEVGFFPSRDVEASVMKYTIPDSTRLEGLREMEKSDVDQVQELWARYGKRYDLVLQFDREEIEHWLVSKREDDQKRVLWCYVVEVRDSESSQFCFF